MNQDLDSTRTTTGFKTGETCTSSGTYTAQNKYISTVAIVVAGDPFPPFVDGKKTEWFALSSTSTSSDGSFTTVKVEAGTV